MFENLKKPGNGLRARRRAVLARAALLGSTVLMALPQQGWALTVNWLGENVNQSTDLGSGSSGSLIVGQSSNGSITIYNGAVLTSSYGSIANTSGVMGEVTVTGLGSKWTTGGNLYIGYAGIGTLTIQNGGQVQSYGGNSVGLLNTSTGTVVVTGSGSAWTNSGDIDIGSNGEAALTIADGGVVSNVKGTIANNTGSVGDVTVTGTGSTWTNSGNLNVGYSGTGTLTVGDGGQVQSSAGVLGILLTGTGTVVVTGSGSAWVNSGDFVIGNYGKGTLTIADGGTVSAGTQQEDGSYDKIVHIAYDSLSTGTLNIGAAAGEEAVAAGTLNASGVLFGSGSGTIVFNHTDEDYDFGTAISGYGTINHLSGETILSANSAYFTGITNVTGGTLLVSGILGGSISVSDYGTLGGTGTVGSTTIKSGGTFSPGGISGSVGTLSVNGDLSFEGGSTYAVDLNGLTFLHGHAADLAAVKGTVTIGDGALMSVTALDASTSYQVGHVYTVITSEGGLTGAFTTVSSDSAFLDFTASYDETNAYLTVALKSSGGSSGSGGDSEEDPDSTVSVFAPVASTSNQYAVASALDTLDQTSGSASLALYNSLLMLNESEAQQAYEQLSGDVYATAQGAFVQTNRAVSTALNSRVRAVTDGVAAPSSMVLGYAEEKESVVKDDRFAAFEAPKAAPDRFATWASAFGSWGQVGGTDGGSDTDTSSGGVLIGGDVAVLEDWRAGVLAGFSRSFFDTDNSSGNSTNYHLGTYFGGKLGAVALRSGLNYTWHDVEAARNITVLGQTLNSSYDAGSLNLYGEVAYRIDAGISAFEPFAALAYNRTETGSFTESGGTAALTVDDSVMNTGFTTLGLRASADFDLAGIASVARGTVGWVHAFGDVDPETSARFATGDSFSVTSTPIDTDAALLEAGLDFAVAPSSTFSLGYNGQIGSSAYEHGVNAKFRLQF